MILFALPLATGAEEMKETPANVSVADLVNSEKYNNKLVRIEFVVRDPFAENPLHVDAVAATGGWVEVISKTKLDQGAKAGDRVAVTGVYRHRKNFFGEYQHHAERVEVLERKAEPKNGR